MTTAVKLAAKTPMNQSVKAIGFASHVSWAWLASYAIAAVTPQAKTETTCWNTMCRALLSVTDSAALSRARSKAACIKLSTCM
eukprot:CAMPEP_0198537072 /NCGR_PEP_ID=MMETSP1462-20131121/43522_1 /TAXON_ID=1333877 /ORGANISM="Brandtodinium nutriculum, Strain RCC3387" /LENGTH=82 /DNA_ID=CAMNT_0044267053 /DNA_START=52 /DNA_END=300 /DNA_ORIENTATION=+